MKGDGQASAKIIFIEPFAGISGDMFLGAFLDLGLSLKTLENRLGLLPLTGCRLAARRVAKSGISATQFEVLSETHDHEAHPGHAHHDHAHHERTFREIRRMIGESSLSPWVKEKATAAFAKLAAAEGRIHDRDPEEVHFHEIGALDSIVDIVGAMIAVEEYLPATIVCAPVNVGQGTLECRHGVYPAPAPAALELLRGIPIYSDALRGELTTPTGAALLATLVDRFAERPLMKVRAVGYGAGTRDLPHAANVLRVTVGEAPPPAEARTGEAVTVIEAAVDDMNPQLCGHLFDRLLAAGALDVYLTPVQMKKNRPGVELTVLCASEKAHDLCRLILAETTTLGIRYRPERRWTLERHFETVATPFGQVRIKIGLLDGERVNFAPEYEDCRRLAAESGRPLKEIMSAAAAAFLARERPGAAEARPGPGSG